MAFFADGDGRQMARHRAALLKDGGALKCR
jgi:hypothetical protein